MLTSWLLLAIHLQVCLKINESSVLSPANLKKCPLLQKVIWDHEKLPTPPESTCHCLSLCSPCATHHYVLDLCKAQVALSLFPIKIKAPKSLLPIIKKTRCFTWKPCLTRVLRITIVLGTGEHHSSLPGFGFWILHHLLRTWTRIWHLDLYTVLYSFQCLAQSTAPCLSSIIE